MTLGPIDRTPGIPGSDKNGQSENGSSEHGSSEHGSGEHGLCENGSSKNGPSGNWWSEEQLEHLRPNKQCKAFWSRTEQVLNW